MRLQTYKTKRVFKHTPEPQPTRHKQSKQLHFVIHKHDATHLHYDLRLETDGVLKSWAIPKGPSMNPQDKRLAVMVEDHPYEYKNFEGVIPAGNYGAGAVMIWDEGILQAPDNVKNANRYFRDALQKGHLTFSLQGEKLQGTFNLVKLPQAGNDHWLLMKVKDEFSTAKDILKQDKSVRSGLTIQQIDGKTTVNVSELAGAIKASMPSQVKPMLATLVNQAFDREEWVFEIKWDGYRIVAMVNGKSVKLHSRHQQDYSQSFAPVTDALSKLNIKAVFDGEVVVVDKQGRSHFQLLQNYLNTKQGTLIYYIFDVIWYDGYDIRDVPLIQRQQLLKQILPVNNYLKISEAIETSGKVFYKAAVKHDLEGIMAKDANSSYEENTRSKSWLKIKHVQQQETVICGYTAPKGSRKHIGALILGVYDNSELIYVGHSGSGFSASDLARLKRELAPLIRKTCPFKVPPKTNAPPTWLKPQRVCEVAFQEWTRDGLLRQPIFLGIRDDKAAHAVHREIEQQVTTAVNPTASVKAHKKNKKMINISDDVSTIIVNRHPVHLTHLSKLFWPALKISKGDMVHYYHHIAPYILPYLKDRPQSLHRFPDGIHGNHFFQKNISDAPDWVKTYHIHSEHEGRDIEYLLCNDEAALLYLANLACIEIHPWLSRVTHLDHPDYCVVDLDPEKIAFEHVVNVAQHLHQLLDTIGADHYCKTSGMSGLHIFIPLGGKYNYDQSLNFVKLICEICHSQLPKLTSLKRLPKQRQGKVYLDVLQNRRGQTIVAPYSLRPSEHAAVSAPLLWSEVNTQLNPQKFTMQNMLHRLEKMGDVWQPVLGKAINMQKCIAALQKLLKI